MEFLSECLVINDVCTNFYSTMPFVVPGNAAYVPQAVKKKQFFN